MIIAGAGGHARELLGILSEMGQVEDVFFFDDVAANPKAPLWNRFPVLRNTTDASRVFQKDPRFIIGVGNPASRKAIYTKLVSCGGSPFSVISPHASIGEFNVRLGEGLNILTQAIITQDVSIDTGTLVHMQATVHHDCVIGKFCELSPGCHILGRASLGDLVSIGAGAVVLPGIHIGEGAVIGAGAVVTKNVEAGSRMKGVPAR